MVKIMDQIEKSEDDSKLWTNAGADGRSLVFEVRLHFENERSAGRMNVSSFAMDTHTHTHTTS